MKRTPGNAARLAALLRKLRRHADRINTEVTGAIAVAREAIPLMPREHRAACRASLREMIANFKRARLSDK